MIEEKRKSRRFAGRIGIVSADDDGLNFSFVTDLCRDGARIETEKLLPVGTEFEFVLSNKRLQAPIRGRVMWVKDAFFHGGHSSLGVKFESLEANAKVLRDDLLLYLMALRYPGFWQAA